MPETKKIVFETSDIFNYQGISDGPVKFEFTDSSGKDQKLCSTMVLEWAIEEGYEVFVASTRSHLMDSDEWWTKLVPADHIFLSDVPTDGKLVERDPSSGWKRLFEHLGIAWPEEPHSHWVHARMELENHGITLAWRVRSDIRRKDLKSYREWSRLNRKYESTRAQAELVRTHRGVVGGAYGAYITAKRKKEKQA